MESSSVHEGVHGFKVFAPDWTCRNFRYEVGNIYEIACSPICCERGFHFCMEAVDCFHYYKFNPNNKVAEVVALGEVDYERPPSTKCSTNRIWIVREIPWDEVLHIVNIGKCCTGNCNTGDYNTGNHNTGNYNTGRWNTGNRNTGNYNTGNCNTGNDNTGNRNTGKRNTGNRNTGNCNTGDCNTGNRNTGDWNKSSFNTGCFMTEEQKISMFDKPSDWTYNDWMKSSVRYLLNQIPKDVVEWICVEDMTEEEKIGNSSYKTAGGYLRVLDESERGQLWWESLSDDRKQIIKSMPNFDAGIFEECTGIKIEM